MNRRHPVRILVAILITTGLLVGLAKGEITLTVDEFNSSTVTFSISGTLDSPATGTHSGVFHFAPEADLSIQWYSGNLRLVASSLNLGGAIPTGGVHASSEHSRRGYSIHFYRGDVEEVLPAGMPVSGSVTFTGAIDDVGFSAEVFDLYNGDVRAATADVHLTPKHFGLFTYEVDGDSSEIRDYPTSVVGDIEIPAEIDGRPVTSIGDSAFLDCSGLRQVTFPPGVTAIGHSAFSGCSGLTGITLPTGLVSIDPFAFSGCSSLTEVAIPPRVTSIGKHAFAGCSGLSHITLPPGLTSISNCTFDNCSGLTSAFIPLGVTCISNGAFDDCSGLTCITIPPGVTILGNYAFSGCTGLTAAVFLGDAPELGIEEPAFDSVGEGFSFYYRSSSSGFTSPTWNGYPATPINEALYSATIDQISSISFTPESLRLELTPPVLLGPMDLPFGGLGRSVGIEYSPDMSPGSWIQLGNFFETQGTWIFTDPDLLRLARPSGFYRAFLRPPPP